MSEIENLKKQLEQSQTACAAKDSALESVPHLADHLIRAERETDRGRMLAHLDHAQIITDKVNAARSPNSGQPILDELARLREEVESYKAMKEGVEIRISDLEAENERLRISGLEAATRQERELERLREVVERFGAWLDRMAGHSITLREAIDAWDEARSPTTQTAKEQT